MKEKKLGVSNTPYDGGWWVTDGGRWVATKHQRVDAIVKKKKKKGECPYGTPCDSEGGWEGVGWDPPSALGPPMVPAKGGPKIFKPKSSWGRTRRSKIEAVSLQHWKGRRGGGVQRG